jgi:hypothetical protein
MTEIQNYKRLDLEFWNFGFIWNLVLVICDLMSWCLSFCIPSEPFKVTNKSK